ncbi:MAG: proprotein convertase P-domain-containing protein [Myxococcota bacterium]
MASPSLQTRRSCSGLRSLRRGSATASRPPTVGYGWSKLEVAERGDARSARVDVDIDHTYRGDLELFLVTPSGKHLHLSSFSGQDNDIHDHFDVQLPPETRAEGTWHLLAADGAGLDVGTIDAWSLTLAEDKDPADPNFRKVASADVPVFIPDAPDGGTDEGLALIEVEAAPIDELAGRYGRVEVDEATHFLRLDLEAAAELQPAPEKASVVFVVDASHSTVGVMEQLKLARGYMAHVPDAEAQVVLFRRVAERVTSEFLAADDLWAAMERAEGEGRLDPGNGSALENGLRLAAKALRGRRGPKRIVLLTDARLRTRFRVEDGEDAAGLAPRNTITHIVVPGPDRRENRLFRADDHALASIPATTEGVLFELQPLFWADDKEFQTIALDLVRPTAIDEFELHGIDLDAAPRVPEVFREGSAYGFMLKSTESPSRVRVTGKIWNREFSRVIRADRRFGRATAAFVFSEDEHHGLDYEQMMKLAMHGRAVSPVTSYLATEPGVRPSTIGLEETGRGGGGTGEGTIGLGSTGLIGKGGGGGSAPKAFTLEELLEGGVSACVEAHHPAAGWRVELEVETTSQEIVDVQEVSGPRALRRCLLEAAWAVTLTWNFDDERKTHHVRLGA